MSSQLTRIVSPEEQELQLKELELFALETQVAALLLELETLREELGTFTQQYLRIVGVKYAELDAIEAEISRILAARSPQDQSARQAADDARQRAEESRRETADAQERPERPPFRPSAELKELYRTLARRVHPDLARDSSDRERRERLMKAVNQAYRDGDAVRLQQILAGLEDDQDPDAIDDIGTRLVKVIRRISAAKRRITELQVDLSAIRASEAAKLREKAEQAAQDGRDFFSDLVTEIEIQIEAKRQELRTLTEGC